MAEAKSSSRYDSKSQSDDGYDSEAQAKGGCKATSEDESEAGCGSASDGGGGGVASAGEDGCEGGAAGTASDDEVEAEFQAKLKIKNQGEITVSSDPQARKIAEGFTINWMDMRDAETGALLWESGKWGSRMLREEMTARVPKGILACRAVSRELNFTSAEEIRTFRLEQRVFLNGVCLEEWFFNFGFVIPGSTNSWQQTIEAAAPEDMRDPAELSGKVTIETSFYDGRVLIAKTLVRVFYV